VRIAITLYRAATVLLPAAFRAEHGGELVACFARIAADARRAGGRAGLAAATVRAIADLLTRAVAARAREVRHARIGAGLVQGVALDIRHAARRLVRRPGFTVTSALTLALGLAAATSVFSLVHGVVLNPLPYPEPRRIVDVDHAAAGAGASQGGLGITYGFYRFYAERLRSVQALAMYSDIELALVGLGDPVRLNGVRATPSLVDVLRMPPRLGRWFTGDEGRPGAEAVVVLSEALWRDRFGADPGVLGRTIDLGGVRQQVVGVMPADFAFPTAGAAFYLPRVVPATGIGGWNERAVARLAPDADPAAVEREIRSLYPALRASTDSAPVIRQYLDDAGVVPLIRPLHERVTGDVAATLWVLLGTVAFVLLVAVANVANLFLVRAEDGGRELALRRALGASGGRLLRTALAEPLLLACAAGALALAGAWTAIRTVRAAAPASLPRLHEVGLSPEVVLVLVAVTLIAGLALGVVPVIHQRFAPRLAASSSTRGTTGGRLARQARHVLMGAQVALALALLIGAGLLFRSYLSLRAVDPGFTERQALVFEIGLPQTRYADRQRAKAFHDRLIERLRALPGVTATGAVGRCLPLGGNMCGGEVLDVDGRPRAPGVLPPVTGARIVTGDYFRALGIAVRGRVFTPADERGAATVVILSAAAADAYFPGEDPIGQRVRFGSDRDPWHTIVGVASNVRAKVDTDEFVRTIYLPVLPDGADGPSPFLMSYVLRTSVPPSSIAGPVREAVRAIDPAVPVAALQPLQSLVDRATAPAAFALAVVGAAAAMALLLGLVGVYAVVSYAVSQRTREIGVRLALGARPGEVRRMVVRQGAAVVVGGAAAGLVAALWLTRFLGAMLHDVSATDPASFAALTLAMLLVAALALWLPARRASRVDPIEALRVE
jgi:predicted permease